MSPTLFTRTAAGAAALVSVFALAACGSSSNSAAPESSDPSAATGAPATDTPTSGQPSQSSGPTPRCTTENLSVTLGKAKPDGSQMQLPLVFKNVGEKTCDLHGTPGVDLHGPNHPAYGPVDSLLRRENGAPHNVLAPGRTATALITVLPSSPNPPAESPAWTAQSLETIPPGQTKALHAEWPADLAITRQDGATHPGTWVDGINADPS